jgi:hypothetical protein
VRLTLGLSEGELIARVADLEQERDGYRLTLQQTLHALHHAVTQRDRLRTRLHQLHERRAA